MKQISLWEQYKTNYADINERFQLAHLDEDLNRLMYQSPELEKSEKTEEPMLFMLISPDGGPIYYHSFSPDWAVDEMLFGAFLTAFNSFSDELFAESLDRANFGQYNILMKTFENIKLVYVFKGPSYKAQQKFVNVFNVLTEGSGRWTEIREFSDENKS